MVEPIIEKPTLLATVLLGSPRDGNSHKLARGLSAGLRTSGWAIDEYVLRDLHYSGCRNLFRCKSDLSHCGLHDDLQPVLESISSSQVLILATPIYFTDISSDLKAAIERMFSFFVPDYPNQKQKSRLTGLRDVVFVQTQGEPEDQYGDLPDRYWRSFSGLGYTGLHRIRVCGIREPDAIVKDNPIWQQVDQLAAELSKRFAAT